MSQDNETQRPATANEPVLETTDAPRETPAQEPASPAANAEGPTIGTGTSIALGCIAGTILLIVIGLLYILILAIF